MTSRGGYAWLMSRTDWLAMLFSVVFLLPYSNEAFGQNCVVNFGKPYCGNFTFTKGVIVKTHLSKTALAQTLSTQIQQIATLDHANLYLVHTDEPQKTADWLVQQPYVEYAQPDIIQLRSKANHHDKLSRVALELAHDEPEFTGTGKGVSIAVIDDGFNLQHEDLKDVALLFEYDVDNQNLDAANKLTIDNHGTLVAGVIFAQHNGIGVNGIAPESSFIAIRQPENKTSSTVLSFTVADKAGADIINASWNSPVLMQPVYDVIKHLALNGRNGKGTAVVFAAGNDAQYLDLLSIEAAIPEAITVGTHGAYSNVGPLIDVIVPAVAMSTSVNGGYKRFGGTSAAAPYVSGHAALILEQNSELALEQLISRLKSILTSNH